MASNRKILIACRMRHDGASFQEVANVVGVSSSSTIHRWSESEVWREETARLRKIDQEEVAKQYRQELKKSREQYEKLSRVGLGAALKILQKLSQLCDRIDIEDFADSKDQVVALKNLTSAFDTLATGSKTLWEDVVGLETVIGQLEENQCPKV